MENTTSEQVNAEADLEETDQAGMAAEKTEDPEAATELGRKQRGPLLLKGISSKKRNVQQLTSPRKRVITKGGDQVNEGNTLKNHGTVKGTTGGGKPPKPKVDK
ncbi:unnamed protein product [Arabidopsis halleri]